MLILGQKLKDLLDMYSLHLWPSFLSDIIHNDLRYNWSHSHAGSYPLCPAHNHSCFLSMVYGIFFHYQSSCAISLDRPWVFTVVLLSPEGWSGHSMRKCSPCVGSVLVSHGFQDWMFCLIRTLWTRLIDFFNCLLFTLYTPQSLLLLICRSATVP